MIFNLIEVEVGKDTHQNAARVLNTLLEACVDKVDSLVSVQIEKINRGGKDKDAENDFHDFALIEKSRPLLGPCYATEKPEESMAGVLCFRHFSICAHKVFRIPQSHPHTFPWVPQPCGRTQEMRRPHP